LEKDHFNKFTIWATARQALTPFPKATTICLRSY